MARATQTLLAGTDRDNFQEPDNLTNVLKKETRKNDTFEEKKTLKCKYLQYLYFSAIQKIGIK